MEPKKEKKHLFPKFSKRTKTVFVVTFFVGVVFLFATYAWFSASLNVKIKFFLGSRVHNEKIYFPL